MKSISYEIPGGDVRRDLIELIEDNHTLIAGTTGAGKSVLENSIIYNLLMCAFPGGCVYPGAKCKSAKFVMIDPKKVELRQYEKLPHTLQYADTPAKTVKVLEWVRKMIDCRLNDMIYRHEKQSSACPIYVFIDELVDLMTSRHKKDILQLLIDCMSISRATNIFFVLCTQAPARSIIPAPIKLNCSCRIALRCNNAIESRQIIDTPEAVNLPMHGKALVVQGVYNYAIDIPMYDNNVILDTVRYWEKQHPLYNLLLRHKTRVV